MIASAFRRTSFIPFCLGLGVSGLLKAFAGQHQQQQQQHRLLGLLSEALLSVYVGLCLCGLYARDSCVLYRLVDASARLGDPRAWFRVFGGCYRLKPLRPPTPQPPPPSPQPSTARLSPTPVTVAASKHSVGGVSRLVVEDIECQTSSPSCCSVASAYTLPQAANTSQTPTRPSSTSTSMWFLFCSLFFSHPPLSRPLSSSLPPPSSSVSFSYHPPPSIHIPSRSASRLNERM